MTVGQLLEYLNLLPRDMPVAALYDCRCAGGTVVAVETGPGPDDPCDSVLLVIE